MQWEGSQYFDISQGGTRFLVQSVYAAVGVEMEPQLAGEEVIPEDVWPIDRGGFGKVSNGHDPSRKTWQKVFVGVGFHFRVRRPPPPGRVEGGWILGGWVDLIWNPTGGFGRQWGIVSNTPTSDSIVVDAFHLQKADVPKDRPSSTTQRIPLLIARNGCR